MQTLIASPDDYEPDPYLLRYRHRLLTKVRQALENARKLR